jgi:exodeoxyribonuclease VII large subunit
VLARGYAFVLDAQQRPVVSAHAVQAGQPLALQWHDGQVEVHVDGPMTRLRGEPRGPA